MKAKNLLSLSLLFIAQTLMAQTVSEDAAMDAAKRFLSSRQTPDTRGNIELKLAHKAADQDKTFYYVFNKANGGFVIVGGDKVAEEILGYSDNGSFDMNNIPSNMRWWLQTYEQSIDRNIVAVRDGRLNVDELISRRASKTRAESEKLDIEPLLGNIEWDQGQPYNMAIPGNTADTEYMEQYATGCVATAVAQIMMYHKWPEHGYGANTYFNDGQKHSIDFSQQNYNWDLMQNQYQGYNGTDAEDEVAKLMYHVGVGVNMQYDKMKYGGSGATNSYVLRALNKYFGYSAPDFIYRDNLTDEDRDAVWESMVYESLFNHSPVFYTGRTEDDNSGHAFVCDGYKKDDNTFHINWGWGGAYNGYFLLTSTESQKALAPNGTGAGGADEGDNYSNSQCIGINIKPNKNDFNGPNLEIKDIIVQNQGYYVQGEFEIKFIMRNNTTEEIRIMPIVWVFEYGKGNSTNKYMSYNDGEKDEAEVVIPANDTFSFTIKDNYNELNNKTWYMLMMQDYNTREIYVNIDPIVITSAEDIDYELTDAEWGTICLPYDAQIPVGLMAYEVTGADYNEGSLVLREADLLEMNKAYLLNGTPGRYEFHGPETPKNVYKNGILFGITSGGSEYKEVPQGSYVLQNHEGAVAFYKVTQDGYLAKKYSAYLTPDTNISTSVLNINGATAIEKIEKESETDSAPTYNLNGQRTVVEKGFTIKNGKLKFVK